VKNVPLQLAVAAMGTRFEVVLLSGSVDLRAAGEAALAEIESWHRRLSRFAQDSLLSHINRSACHSTVRLDRDTYELLDDAVRVWRSSEGAFDITVAPLLVSSGYADSAVSARDGFTGCGAISLDPGNWTIRFRRLNVTLDLGGIAKGHALDCAARVLRDGGVSCALLHGGTSSIVAIGAPEGTDGWRVAMGCDADARVVTLRDTAMSVSDGSSQRQGQSDTGHIMNPRTGTPVPGAVRATVIGPSARLADAWSTALVVLGSVPAGFPSDYMALIGVTRAARSEPARIALHR
jgi:FAD:protein FMN transferase